MEANIIVAFPRLDDAKNVKNILVKNGFSVAAVVNSGAGALSAADSLRTGIIISAYKLPDMPYFEICECMPRGFELLLIASRSKLGEGESPGVVKLAMPFMVSDLIETVGMMKAAATGRKSRRLSAPKVRSGQDEEILRQAKGVLMERNGLTEAEAHKFIQKCSMDSGVGLIESARMVFSMYGAPKDI